MRKGLGRGKGRGYYNIVPIDSHIHSLSAKGVKQKQLYACKKNKLKAMGQVKQFKINKQYSVVAWSEGTSRGFRHVAILMKNGRQVEKATANYLNRTWESYDFESVIYKLLNKEFEEDKAQKMKKRLEENKSGLFAKGVVYSKPKMANEITKFIKKMKKKYGDDDDNFVVDRDAQPLIGDITGMKKSEYIQLRTDGLVYEQLFDPSMSEMPYLIRDAIEEFGMDKKKVKVPTGYEEQEAFGELLQKHGWDFEIYGQGIIEIYKQVN